MSTMSIKSRYATQPGFTLLEMVIVVAILAVLAGIAVRGVDGLDQQARFEATRRVMRDVNDAVLATGQDADGSLLISGFVADMGRLPWAYSYVDPTTQLTTLQPLELWSNPNNALQPFAVRQAMNLQCNGSTYSDSTVFIASGWRGNYLRLGVGQSSLQDGWGQSFGLLKWDNTPAQNQGVIGAVVFAGSNDAGANNGYATPITVWFAGADTC